MVYCSQLFLRYINSRCFLLFRGFVAFIMATFDFGLSEVNFGYSQSAFELHQVTTSGYP